MREPGRHRGLTPSELGLAILAALAILVITFTGAQRARDLTIERRAGDDLDVVAEITTGMAADIERGLAALASAAESVSIQGVGALAGPGAVTAVPGADDIGFVAAPGRPGAAAVDAPPLSPADLDDPAVAALLDRSVNTSDAQLGAPIELAAGPRLLMVAAVYRTDASGPPTSTTARRERHDGWVVAPIDPGRMASTHLTPGATATIRDGSTNFPVPDVEDVPSRLPERSLDSNGRRFVIKAGSPDPITFAAPTVLLFVGGTIAAAVAATLLVLSARRRHELEDEAARYLDQVRLIGEVAPVVQQSLELADVLPAVAVQLSDQFGLLGVSLSSGTSGAGQLELFSTGTPPDPRAIPLLRPPDRLPSGATLTLALQRGGRSVALLQLVAGRALDEAELQSLRALTELVTAAVVNAGLYASQQEAMHRLRELDGLKTVFLGTASHELRTPVTAIAGFASLLTKNWDQFDTDQRKVFAERIAANAQSLNSLVQDLLDFSQLDQGNLSLVIQPVELGPVVGSVVDRLGSAFSEHEIVYLEQPVAPVAGDVNGIERIVTNLLANAVKFSPSETTITVAVGADVDGAVLTISDEGPGVPADEREQIFSRFFRGTGEAVLQTRGVGIGLSVVAEFVDRMEGEVFVDDAPGGGARFTVRLPFAPIDVMPKETQDAPTV